MANQGGFHKMIDGIAFTLGGLAYLLCLVGVAIMQSYIQYRLIKNEFLAEGWTR